MSNWLCENDLSFVNALTGVLTSGWSPHSTWNPCCWSYVVNHLVKCPHDKGHFSPWHCRPSQPASCKVSPDLSPPPRKPFMKPILLLIDSLNVPLLPPIFPLWTSFLFIHSCPAHLSRSFHQVLAQPKSFHIALLHTIHLPILYILTVIVIHAIHGKCDCFLAFFCIIPQFWYYCLTVRILTLRPDCNAVQTINVYLLAITQY